MIRMTSTKTRHGIAPCRGMADGFVSVDFFLILEEAIPELTACSHVAQDGFPSLSGSG